MFLGLRLRPFLCLCVLIGASFSFPQSYFTVLPYSGAAPGAASAPWAHWHRTIAAYRPRPRAWLPPAIPSTWSSSPVWYQ